MCVVLSRGITLKGLILNEKLDYKKIYEIKNQLLKWKRKMKNTIEKRAFKDRSKYDYWFFAARAPFINVHKL